MQNVFFPPPFPGRDIQPSRDMIYNLCKLKKEKTSLLLASCAWHSKKQSFHLHYAVCHRTEKPEQRQRFTLLPSCPLNYLIWDTLSVPNISLSWNRQGILKPKFCLHVKLVTSGGRKIKPELYYHSEDLKPIMSLFTSLKVFGKQWHFCPPLGERV